MKILGLAGSPRKGGNTDILLDRALSGGESKGFETEKIYLSDLEYCSCTACDKCATTGICAVEDGMGLVYDKVAESAGLILAAPIYFHGVPGHVKAMIDRFQCKWAERFVLRKRSGSLRPAAFISVGGRTQPRFDVAQPVVKIFFGMAGYKYAADLFVPNRDNLGFVGDEPEWLDKAFALGVGLAEECRG